MPIIYLLLPFLTTFVATFGYCDPGISPEVNKIKKTYTHPTLGFTLTFPNEFELVPLQIEGVGVALRHASFSPAPPQAVIPTGGFPTFTVTIHPGALRKEHSITRQTEDIILSYKKIGLTDTSLLHAESINHPEGERRVVQLTYTNNGIPYRSEVTLVPGKSYHYYLTYVDTAAHFPLMQQYTKTLRDGFSSGEMPPVQTKQRYPLRDRLSMLFASLFAFGVIFWMAWYQKRREGNAVR